MIAPSTLKAGKARPSFADMIAAAISDLKGPAKGSSRIAIKNYIKANYSDLPDSGRFNYCMRTALNKLVDSNALLINGDSFRLSKQANGTASTKSRKPQTTKTAPSSTKKKAVPKKKTTTTTAKAKKAPSSTKKKAAPKKKAVAALKKTKNAAATKKKVASPKKKAALEVEGTLKEEAEAARLPPLAEATAPPASPAVPAPPTGSPSPMPFTATAIEATQMA